MPARARKPSRKAAEPLPPTPPPSKRRRAQSPALSTVSRITIPFKKPVQKVKPSSRKKKKKPLPPKRVQQAAYPVIAGDTVDNAVPVSSQATTISESDGLSEASARTVAALGAAAVNESTTQRIQRYLEDTATQAQNVENDALNDEPPASAQQDIPAPAAAPAPAPRPVPANTMEHFANIRRVLDDTPLSQQEVPAPTPAVEDALPAVNAAVKLQVKFNKKSKADNREIDYTFELDHRELVRWARSRFGDEADDTVISDCQAIASYDKSRPSDRYHQDIQDGDDLDKVWNVVDNWIDARKSRIFILFIMELKKPLPVPGMPSTPTTSSESRFHQGTPAPAPRATATSRQLEELDVAQAQGDARTYVEMIQARWLCTDRLCRNYGRICWVIDSPDERGAARHRPVSDDAQASWARSMREQPTFVSVLMPSGKAMEMILRDHLERRVSLKKSSIMSPTQLAQAGPTINFYGGATPSSWVQPERQQEPERQNRILERIESSPVRSDSDSAEILTAFFEHLKQDASFSSSRQQLTDALRLLIQDHYDVDGIKSAGVSERWKEWELPPGLLDRIIRNISGWKRNRIRPTV